MHGIQGYFRGIVPGTTSIFLRNGAAMVALQYMEDLVTYMKWSQCTEAIGLLSVPIEADSRLIVSLLSAYRLETDSRLQRPTVYNRPPSG
eukprot:gene7776-17305_t